MNSMRRALIRAQHGRRKNICTVYDMLDGRRSGVWVLPFGARVGPFCNPAIGHQQLCLVLKNKKTRREYMFYVRASTVFACGLLHRLRRSLCGALRLKGETEDETRSLCNFLSREDLVS